MSLKQSVYNVCVNILGFVKKKYQDWFDKAKKIQAVTTLAKGHYPTEKYTRLFSMQSR